MSLTLKKASLVPLTRAMAEEFRDMTPLPGERELSSARAKEHMGLLSRDKFYSLLWGKCLCNGVWYRGNGNHTSNVLCLCLQQHSSGLDDKSKLFFDEFLSRRGGLWSGKFEDIPEVTEGDLNVFVEEFIATDANDLVEFFRRYDSSSSARSAKDILGIFAGECAELRQYDRALISKVLTGVIKAARFRPEAFGIREPRVLLAKPSDRGSLLREPKIYETVIWIIEHVSDPQLYKTPIGSQLIADTYVDNPDKAENVVEELLRQIDAEEDPGYRFWLAYTKVRNRPSPESVLKKGRDAMRSILRRLDSELVTA